MLCYFWCSVVTSIMFRSKVSNFEKNPKNLNKNPKMSKKKHNNPKMFNHPKNKKNLNILKKKSEINQRKIPIIYFKKMSNNFQKL